MPITIHFTARQKNVFQYEVGVNQPISVKNFNRPNNLPPERTDGGKAKRAKPMGFQDREK
jgi:hypothetical protein